MKRKRGDDVVHFVTVNGLKMAYLDQGSGPIVLLLHGFPDIASTWEKQIACLTKNGYRAVAPFLRGYAPTEVPTGAFFDKATLVEDIAALIRAISPNAPIDMVGQDWGAIIGYSVCAAYPELLKRAVLMAVPHPMIVAQNLLVPKHVHRSFHRWFFQMEKFPEEAILANDMAFIDYLWQYWTVAGFEDQAHIRLIKDTLKQPGVLTATLDYYRAMFDASKADPALSQTREKMNGVIAVPTLALCGAEDLRAELMMQQEPYFSGEYAFELIPQSGHFLHREQPTLVNHAILDWLKQ